MGWAARSTLRGLNSVFGGPARSRVILLLAAVLALNSADTATVGASATQLRQALGIDNADIGLLVAVTSIVAAVASLPFGVLVDRVRRTGLLAWTIALWGIAMLVSASVSSFDSLLLARVFLGAATAAAGPAVASLVGDYFPSSERGKIYSYILAGELLGAGVGFVITGDVAALSWRAAFVVLAIPTLFLTVAVHRLPEPARGGASQMAPGEPNVIGADEARRRQQRAVAGYPGGVAPGAPSPSAPGGAPPGGQEGAVDGVPAGGTDAQHLAQDRGIGPDPHLVLRTDPRRMHLIEAVRYILRIRTNVILIVSSACGYFFLAGVETFGIEFSKGQYNVGQALANLLILAIGGGAVLGVLVGGRLGDFLLRRRHLNGRILVAGVAALSTVALFVPALVTRSIASALPYMIVAAFMLTAQNPPIDAARLDIMPPLLWGRAEGVRTFLRTGAQSIAPLLFGAFSDLIGGGHTGLQYTFIIMLLPLAASGIILLRALRTYPRDVATAAASLTPGQPGVQVPGGDGWRG